MLFPEPFYKGESGVLHGYVTVVLVVNSSSCGAEVFSKATETAFRLIFVDIYLSFAFEVERPCY